MKPTPEYVSRCLELNRAEFGANLGALKWIAPASADEAALEREDILTALRNGAVFCCKDTKLDGRRLSPGCRICAEGDWSCLFINGRCNCRCFYCPAPQNSSPEPTTNSVPFANPADYADYIERLGFRGVSFSGGEPLLTPESTLSYLSAVKSRFGDAVHTWLYTNGTLATPELLAALRRAGLNEIRFDIGANGMNLDAARIAAGIIPTVTVEIPAIPEEFEAMKEKIREMQAAGVRHLNLHQLRLTPHNFKHLSSRNYTFLHGERVTVLESELAALRLIRWTLEENVDLPVNYCSFVYKHRYQRAAARRRSAAILRAPHEDITENGYLRALWVEGAPESLNQLAERLRRESADTEAWRLDASKNRLYVPSTLWKPIDFDLHRPHVSYAQCRIAPRPSYRRYFKEFPLNPGKSVVVERENAGGPFPLDRESAEALRGFSADGAPPLAMPSSPAWEAIAPFEFIEPNLPPYF